jgi:predicted nucleotide-binding protein (sugar kinase/HSP70/actin superfamily)
MTRVGIPRALVYYEYWPMWRAFLQALDMQVVVSPPTNRSIIAAGLERMVAETCLPVKVYAGHVSYLRDQGVDAVLVPAIRATEPGLFHCSKFLGLPDLMAAVVENCPPILELDVDIGKKRRDLQSVIREFGKTVTWKPWLVHQAVQAAWEAHLAYQQRLRTGMGVIEAMQAGAEEQSVAPALRAPSRSSPHQFRIPHRDNSRSTTQHVVNNALHSSLPLVRGVLGRGLWEHGHEQDVRHLESGEADKTDAPTIALVGHPYLLYDAYITHNLLSRLRQMGARLLTPQEAPPEGLEEGIVRITGTKYWVYEGEMTGAAGYYLSQPEVDGVIALIAFGCGPDSTMLDVVQRSARQQHKPLMSLVLDEHSSEAGLVTRLEAFVDMVVRRQQRRHAWTLT